MVAPSRSRMSRAILVVKLSSDTHTSLAEGAFVALYNTASGTPSSVEIVRECN